VIEQLVQKVVAKRAVDTVDHTEQSKVSSMYYAGAEFS
jgi:hypothetical protein